MSSRFYSKRLRDKDKKRANVRRPRSRPKSFKTEEAAKKWAEGKKLKDYTLKNIRHADSKVKKIVVVCK